MKKRAIGAIALLTITLSVFTHGEDKPQLNASGLSYKAIIKPRSLSIDNEGVLLSKTDRSNLSQADGGE